MEMVKVTTFSGERRGWPPGVYVDMKKDGFWVKTPMGVEEIKAGDWVGTDTEGNHWVVNTSKEKKRLSKAISK